MGAIGQQTPSGIVLRQIVTPSFLLVTKKTTIDPFVDDTLALFLGKMSPCEPFKVVLVPLLLSFLVRASIEIGSILSNNFEHHSGRV